MELLVTMMVIMVISGLVLTAVGGNDGTNDLNSAISRADGVFSLARSAAISRQTQVRVLVCNDPGNTEHFLRFLTIYYFDSGAGKWLPFMEGEFLPRGIFVDVASIQSGTEPRALMLPSQNIYDLDAIDMPENLIGNTSGNWLVYEFHANGTARFPMSRFVVGRSIQAQPFNVIPNKFMRAGFVLFRSGKVVHFQSPEHLVGALNL